MASPLHRLRDPVKDPSGQIVHNVSEPSPPTVGALLSALECSAFKLRKQQFPVRQFGRTTGPSIHPQTDLKPHAPRDAPEPDSQ
jgi:hypothetical protein